MNSRDVSNECRIHFDVNKKVGKHNLIKSFLEQFLLKNIDDQKSVAERFATYCEVNSYSVLQEIYSQNEFGTNYLYFVLIGTCNLYVNNHLIAEAYAGECFGEFPILDARVKYAVTARAKVDCCIAKVSEDDLRKIADKHPGIWQNMAKMLAMRLQKANKSSSFKKPGKKLRIFIGSSTEGLKVASKIQSELSNDFEPVIWNQGPFDILGKSYLEALEDVVNQYDYGIFIFTPDDKIESRGEIKIIARDNVIFELGMFVGRLTRKKAFLIHPRDLNLKILSDFDGIVKGSYDPETENLHAALGPVCDKLRESIKKENIAQQQ